jgi:hypothetical protein
MRLHKFAEAITFYVETVDGAPCQLARRAAPSPVVLFWPVRGEKD